MATESLPATMAPKRLPVDSPTDTVPVLHVINGEHYSGAERVQDLLGLALPKFGYAAGFACLKPNLFPEMRQSVDVPIHELKMRSRFDLSIVRRLTKIVKEGKYRAIHAHTPRTLMIARMAASRLNSIPLIYHVHSPVSLDSVRRFQNRMNLWIERWGLKRVDQMICVSNSLARYMKNAGHAEEKITVVPNGVPKTKQTLTRWKPTKRWTLGTVALFRPRKGTEVLLDAIARLKKQGVVVDLLAVGPFETESYKQEIKDQVKRLGIAEQIQWAGFRKDVNAQLEKMDLFVLPSLFGEGLPMVVLEAMAIGLPIVASRVEGIPEAIRDGHDGLIFDPGKADDLADRVREMVEGKHDWMAMSRHAQERQREMFSESSMAKNVAAVYDRLLRSPTR